MSSKKKTPAPYLTQPQQPTNWAEIDAFMSQDAPASAQPPTRTWGEAATDTGRGVMSGLAGLVKAGGDLYGLATGDMDNFASELGKNGQEYWEEGQSAALKAKKRTRQEAMDRADGIVGKFLAGAGETLTDPSLIADTVATNIATLLPGAAAGRAAAGVTFARAANVGPLTKAATAVAATQAARVGTGVAIGTGAVQQGADVASDAYDNVMKKTPEQLAQDPAFVENMRNRLAQGQGEAQAFEQARHETALSVGRATLPAAAAISGIANALPGGSMLERALVGGAARQTVKAGTRFALPKSIAKGALGEGASETIEEGGGAFAGNVATQQMADPNQDLRQGVGEAAGLGFAGGFAMGGAGGAFHQHAPARPESTEVATTRGESSQPGDAVREQKVPDHGPLSRAANIGVEDAAQAVEGVSTATAVAPAPVAPAAVAAEDAPAVEESPIAAPPPAAAAPAPEREPGTAGDFPTYDEAAQYVSEQRRHHGSLPGGRWLPSPKADGTFQLVNQGHAAYKDAEQLRDTKAREALGIQSTDVLAKSGEPFKNRGAAATEQRRRGIETHDVVQLGSGAAYVVRPKASKQQANELADVPEFDREPSAEAAPTQPALAAENTAPAPQLQDLPGLEAGGKNPPVQINGKPVQLTPEQRTEWDRVEKDFMGRFGQAKARYERAVQQKQTDNPDVGLRSAGEQYASEKKALGMQLSAERRRIAGQLTKKEQAAADQQAARVRPGDDLELHGEAVKALSSPAFGKLRVLKSDGTEAVVRRSEVTKAAPKPAAEPSSSPAPAAADAIEGERIDDEWTAFAPTSGTLGIPRAAMPQIKAEHRGAMVNFLNARGIAHEQVEIPAGALKPTQAEFAPAKVQKAREFTGGDRSILVSSDGHVLDGHHQWMGKRAEGAPVKAIRLDAPIKQLLEEIKEFPSAETSEGASEARPEQATNSDSTPTNSDSKDRPSLGPLELVSGADRRNTNRSDSWEFTSADPTEQEYADARKLIEPGMLLNTEYGSSVDQEVTRVVELKPDEYDDHTEVRTQVYMRDQARPRSKESYHVVFARDGKLYDGGGSFDSDNEGYPRIFVMDSPMGIGAESVAYEEAQKAARKAAKAGKVEEATPGKKVAEPQPATDNQPENSGELTNERATAGEQGQEALGGVVPEDDGRAQGERQPRRDDAGSGEAGDAADPGADGAGVPGARSGGGGAEAAHTASAGTGGRARRLGSRGARQARGGVSEDDASVRGGVTPETPAPNIPGADYRISADTRLGQGGEVEKFTDNVSAIKILKDLEASNRRATPDEQRALARYVGWGGLANAFPNPLTGQFKEKWKERGEQLRELLTKQEYDAARRSTRNAHYTSEKVVNAAWRIAERLGFKGGMALESSMGTGNFLGLMPQGLQGATRFVGVEFDSLTSRIAAALYPQATVLHSGFQNVPLPDDAFALAIGNPPFGSESLRFQFKPELRGVSIHNQFFRASLDAVRPGGLQVMVVSRFLMDAQDRSSRMALAERADLVGAIRLPDTAFKENARTEVVTDLVILRKLTPEEQVERKKAIDAANAQPLKGPADERARAALASQVPAWVGTGTVPDPLGGEPMRVNEYFRANPAMVLGKLERSGSMANGADITVRLDADKLDAELDRAIATLPRDVLSLGNEVPEATASRFKALSDSLRIALSGEEPGHLGFDADGKLQRVIEKENAEGGHDFTRQTITPDSPWSEQLYLDDAGRWYRLDVALDADGNKVKQPGKNGKASNLNVYERTVYQKESDVPAPLRLGQAKFDRLMAMVGLRDLLKQQLVLETEDAPKAVMEANRSRLAKAYAAFVDKHGFVNRRVNANLLSGMPDGALVQALELGYTPGVSAKEAAATGQNEAGESASPAPILRERVVPKYSPPTKADSPADALAIALAERGQVDVERIAQLLKTSPEKAIAQLQSGAKPLIFKDPESGSWETANAYLSGQVKRKLLAAQAAGLEENVKALSAVLPEPWTAENVNVTLGANWVPAEIYADFLGRLTGAPARISYSPITNSYSVLRSDDGGPKAAEWSAGGATPSYILGRMLNSQPIVVTRKDDTGNTVTDHEATALAGLKAKEIASEFADWVFADGDRRARLVDLFNEKFNTRVLRQHDGSHLTLPGKVPDTIIRMRRHQLNAIWRGISERFNLLDHTVGAGKTFTAIARAMERRRMGLARKPMMVVPNHLVEQFAADVYRLYPGAKVLAAGKSDFEAKRRRRLFAKIATGDWDIVIVPHSSFKFIGIAPETEQRYLEQEMASALEAVKAAQEEAEEAGQGGRGKFRKPFGVKEAERLVEKIQARMDALNAGKRDKLLTFEQLGVDDLTVDEAHEFKNLFYSSRLTGVRGMGDKTGSAKAADLYNKVRVLHDSPTGAVTFMTGTPISNSAVEMYLMMRYLAPKELRDMGLEHFDAWRANFVEATTKFEPTESGRLKEVNRLGRTWSNMRSLMDLYYSFTDAVSLEDIQRWYAEDNKGKRFPVPKVAGGDRSLVAIKPTAAQDEALKEVMAGFDGLDDIKDPYERNAARLRLMDRARKVSLDVRAVDPTSRSVEKGGKLERVSDEVARIYKKWDADKGTQLIFLDRSVPRAKGDDARIKEYDSLVAARQEALAEGNEDRYQELVEQLERFDAQEVEELRAAANGGWNAYQQIKENLVERGIPAHEIRFIQEAATDEQKKAIFDAVNSGRVRVLLGSTPRMGAGTNVQERLVGLHHVDVTWKPSDIEQREGRIIRQGNQLLDKYGEAFEVELKAYATERTVDAKMWDLNATKLRTINGIRKYDGAFTMEFEDEDSVSMAEMAALASGNPMLLERVTLESQIGTLELLERAHRRKVFGLQDAVDRNLNAIRDLPARIESAESNGAALRTALDKLNEEAHSRTVSVDGKTYSKKMEAENAAWESVKAQQDGNERGRYAVTIGGKRVTNRDAINDTIAESLGDVTPFAAEIGGRRYTQRTAAARDLAERISAAVPSIAKGDSTVVKLGRMLGMELEADVSVSSLGWTTVDLSLSAGGRAVGIGTSSKFENSVKMTAASARNTLERLEADLAEKASSGRVDSMRTALSKAKAALPAAEAALADGREWAKAGELAAKRERLSKVITTLTTGGAPETQAATEGGDQEPSPAPVFNSKEDDYTAPHGDQGTTDGDDRGTSRAAISRLEAAISHHSAETADAASVRPYVGARLPDHSALADIARAFGAELEGFRLRDGLTPAQKKAYGFFNGVFVGGKNARTLLLNADVDRPHLAILGHELAHFLRQNKPGLYERLEKALDRHIRQSKYAEWRATSPVARSGEAKGDAGVKEEFIAEVLSDGLMDSDFWQALHRRNAPLFVSIYKAVSQLLTKLAQTFTGTPRTAHIVNDFRAVMRIAGEVMAEAGILSPQEAPGGLMFNVKEAAAPNLVDVLRGPEVAQQLRQRLGDLFSSNKSFNWWHRTVGTQFHKAKVNHRFGRVYDAAQAFINDVSYVANEAADMAPDILPKLDGLGDITKRLKLSPADQKAVAAAVFTGTLEDEQVYSPAELKSRFKLSGEEQADGTWSGQIGLYQQFRDAVNKSLDFLAAGEIVRYLGRQMDDLPGGLKRMVSTGQLTEFASSVRAAVQAQKDEVDTQLVALKKQQKRERDNLASQHRRVLAGPGGRAGSRLANEHRHDQEINDLKLSQGGELKRAQDKADLWEKVQFDIAEKYDRITQLKDKGYAPLMRFGRYTVDVLDGQGERLYFGMYDSQAEASAAARQLAAQFADESPTVTQGIASQEAFKLFAGLNPETLSIFGEHAGIEDQPLFEQYVKLAASNRSALTRMIRRKGVAGYSEDVSRVLAAFITSNARSTSANIHMGDMDEAVDAIPKQLGDLRDEAQRLRDYVRNPIEEAAKIRGLMFLHFMGGSVASAMVNLTQPFAMTYPYLSQFGGPVRAAKALGRAIKDALTGATDPRVAAALKRAESDGVVSPSEIHQLQAEASRNMGNAPWVRKGVFLWGSLFQLAEKFNRKVTFLAAYRTALERGRGDAFDFASNAVNETQGVYSKANRPNWARGAVGATAFTFKQYSISYMEFLARLPNREKALALAVLVLMAGLQGLPGADDLDDIIDSLGQRLGGYDTNSKRWKRQVLESVFGDTGAELMMRGVSTAMPLDVAGRLSVGNLIPGSGIFRKDRTDKSGDVAELAGPIASVAGDALKGLGALAEGDLMGAAQSVAPVAIKNLIKAFDMGTTGAYRDTRGRRVVDADATDVAVKALGFQPTTVASEQRRMGDAQQSISLAKTVESEIAAAWAEAVFEKDDAGVAKARERMSRWNEKNPDARIAITMPQILRRVREMHSSKKERLLKSAPKEMRATVRDQIGG